MTSSKEEFKTRHSVFDQFTNRVIYKIIGEGLIDGLESPIAIGKESNVFTAIKGDERLIIKIYRLETCDFNRMYDYLRADLRFSVPQNNRRQVVFRWVEREYRNLLIARTGDVRVPKPLAFRRNVLVLEMIGTTQPAPKLKDSPPKRPEEFFETLMKEVCKLYRAGLVHADLSPFNILNYNENPVIIDMSQSTPVQNPLANEYLVRDMVNIANYFIKLGVKASVPELVARVKDEKAKDDKVKGDKARDDKAKHRNAKRARVKGETVKAGTVKDGKSKGKKPNKEKSKSTKPVKKAI